MATRRPRIKAAPNLAVIRARARGPDSPSSQPSPAGAANKGQPTTSSPRSAVVGKVPVKPVFSAIKSSVSPVLARKPVPQDYKPLSNNNSEAKANSEQISPPKTPAIPILNTVSTNELPVNPDCTNKIATNANADQTNSVKPLVQETSDPLDNTKIVIPVESTTTNDKETVNDDPKVLSAEIESVESLDFTVSTKVADINIIESDLTPTDHNEVNKVSTEQNAAKTPENNVIENGIAKAPKISTGQFVNGKYLAKGAVIPDKNISAELTSEKDGSQEQQQPPPKPQQPPLLRRFMGGRNKFKPNLFSRAQQMEVEMNRTQKPAELANLPEVNNPTRTRKHSASSGGEDCGSPLNGQRRIRRNSRNSDGDITKISPTNKSTVTKSPPFAKHTPPNIEETNVDSPDEIVQANDNLPAAQTNHLTNHKFSVNGNTPPLSAAERKRRRRSWSGSNSSGDELHRMRGDGSGGAEKLVNGKPRRRTAESRVPVSDRTNYALKRRKIESKRRFSNGVPGRSTMTMFDLIYYNPDNGTEMQQDEDGDESIAGSRKGSPTRSSPAKSDDGKNTPTNNNIPPPSKNILDKSLDDEQLQQDGEEDSALPVPQVKVGPNGEIIIDESSTMVETTASKRARSDLANSTLVVENAGNKLTNYGTYSKKRKYSDWSEKETFRFYRALSLVGSDFTMMEQLFKKRDRRELKLKFKKEEKINGALVDKCLRQRGQFTDLKSFMDEESEDEEEKADRPTRGRRPKGGKTSRRGDARGRKVSSRGMYDSSSGGEDADVSETSRSPAASRRRVPSSGSGHHPNQRRISQTSRGTPENNIRRVDGSRTPVSADTHSSGTTTKTTSFVNVGSSALQKLPNVKFPPALLAANPGLAQATPGSLVVVASPSKGDRTTQLLHFYMVSDKKLKSTTSSSTITTTTTTSTSQQPRKGTPTPVGISRDGSPASGRSRSPTPTRRIPSEVQQQGRYSIDPAVVRAVDRKRTNFAERDINIYKRQRTLSEGSTISSSKLRSLGRPGNRYPDPFESEPYARTRRISGGLTASDGVQQTTSSTGGSSIVSLSTTVTTTTTSSSETANQAASNEENRTLSELPVARKSRPVLVSE